MARRSLAELYGLNEDAVARRALADIIQSAIDGRPLQGNNVAWAQTIKKSIEASKGPIVLPTLSFKGGPAAEPPPKPKKGEAPPPAPDRGDGLGSAGPTKEPAGEPAPRSPAPPTPAKGKRPGLGINTVPVRPDLPMPSKADFARRRGARTVTEPDDQALGPAGTPHTRRAAAGNAPSSGASQDDWLHGDAPNWGLDKPRRRG